jgi:hypothetical protein
VETNGESTYIFQGGTDSVASLSDSPTAQSLAAELQNPAAPGERHSQMKRSIMPLLEMGLCATAIFSQYRAMYSRDVPDSEIEALIAWGRARLGKSGSGKPYTASARRPEYTDDQKIQNAIGWLNGFQIDPVDLWEASPLRDETEPETILYLRLFRPQDLVNINVRYLIRRLKDGAEKAELCGPGDTASARDWIDHIYHQGPPEGRAGVWVRINPVCSISGNSSSGAHTDADVSRYSRLLLESDILPYSIALSLFAKLPLPICAIIDSAGRGPHAIVSVGAADASEYATKAAAIIKSVEHFGIDPGNSNPSRYSRLPGAKRIIGARADASIQKLLFVTPNPNEEEEISLFFEREFNIAGMTGGPIGTALAVGMLIDAERRLQARGGGKN